ncbi:MAG: TlpA disulfide reductase family protein [Ferruginibacter sp.]
MKKIIILIASFIFFKDVYAQNNFIISGIVNKEYEGASIQFHNYSYKTGAKQFTEVKNGQFVIKGLSKNIYDYCSLSFNKEGKYYFTDFFICKGKFLLKVKKLNINNINNSIEYINFPLMKENEKYKSLKLPYTIKIDKAFIEMEKSIKIKSGTEVIDSLESVVKNFRRQSVRETIRYIKKYRDSYLAFYYFKEDVIPRSIHPDTLKKIFSLFKKSFRNSEEGEIIKQIIKNKQSIVLGNILPDFRFITQDSMSYKLSNFRGKKFVLLCFWASWCGPCIKGFPIFRSINDSFSNKGLQLISISFDDEIEHWHISRKKYDLPWLQTNYLKDFMPDGNIKELYDIRYIPQYFLIDKAGRIIYHSEQIDDDGSYTKLKNLLSKVLNE